MTDSASFADPVPEIHRPYVAAEDRYTHWDYRRVGRSGLFLPPLSLGLWWNFGDNFPFDNQRAVLRHAFDNGITHFDLANNYGPPYGSAEENFGRMMRTDFKAYRSELILSTKAGYDMWPGPYGNFGSRKYLLASLEESLGRMSVDHVDIFYSHRADPGTPLEETIGALDTAVRHGKARYAGISSYSMINRWIEEGLTTVLDEHGVGSIGFGSLAQGLLSDRYVESADPERSQKRGSFNQSMANEDNRKRLKGLAAIARKRGQTLAQMAISWTLRPGGVTSALIGVSSVEQLDENLEAAQRVDFSDEELTEIDSYAGEAGINIWAASSEV